MSLKKYSLKKRKENIMMISRKLKGMKHDSLLLRATYVGISGILFKLLG